MRPSVFAALLLFPFVAQGTVVTTLADEDNGLLGGASGISLREAVKYSPVGDTVTFAPALSGLTIRLLLGEILIADSLTIDGSSLTIRITFSGDKSGNGKTSDDITVFPISLGTVVLDSLIVSGGYKAREAASSPPSAATNSPWKIATLPEIPPGRRRGHPFAKSTGTGTPILTLLNSTFTGNSAAARVVASDATHPVQIQRCSFTGNTARGGAIFMQASSGPTSAFQNSVFANSATEMAAPFTSARAPSSRALHRCR